MLLVLSSADRFQIDCFKDSSINPFMPNGISPLSIRPVHIRFKGCWMEFFHFYSNLDRTICKQTVETLIGRRVMRRLVWVCTVCLRPTKRTLGLYGLIPSDNQLIGRSRSDPTSDLTWVQLAQMAVSRRKTGNC